LRYRKRRTLVMEADIGLAVFPGLALEIGPVRLSGATGFSPGCTGICSGRAAVYLAYRTVLT
jgi:hypothetical protein